MFSVNESTELGCEKKLVVELTPSCPELLSPQQVTPPLVRSVQVCRRPVAMPTMFPSGVAIVNDPPSPPIVFTFFTTSGNGKGVALVLALPSCPTLLSPQQRASPERMPPPAETSAHEWLSPPAIAMALGRFTSVGTLRNPP